MLMESYQWKSDSHWPRLIPNKASSDKWILVLSVVAGLRPEKRHFISALWHQGSWQQAWSALPAPSPRISPSSPDVTRISLAGTLSTGNKWNSTKFSIWTALVRPLNRPTLSPPVLLGSGLMQILECFQSALFGREGDDVWKGRSIE